jgi:serine/threonine protein kinase/Flp pilus assembly protein TadD
MIGKTISHYKILEKLGEGGMGVVYKAHDTELERDVAIKFLPRQIAANSDERERFKIEAKAAAALNHPNIATIHAIEEVDDEMFIVMEHIQGRELRGIVASHRDALMPVTDVLNYATQIAEGLEAAHEKGVIHRDIKSANIIVTDKGQVKIMDFGLAKVRGAQLTKVGTTLGTAAYMSPEQSRGEETDHRTDIWSLGVVLYEMLTGEMPFKGDYEQAVVYSILNEEPRLISSINGSVPPQLEDVVTQALAKNLDERFQNTVELLVDLKAVGDQLKDVDRKVTISQNEKSKGKVPYFYAGIAVVIVLITLINILFFPKEEQGKTIGTLAVLPFSNIKTNPETDYLGFALANQIIGDLVYLKNISVRSSSSIRKYEKQVNDPIIAGNELKVNFVLTGNYLKEANDIRLNVELVEVNTNEMIWRERIEVEYRDAFKLQDIVSEKVIKGLRIQFSQDEIDRMQSNVPHIPLAYEYYLRSISYPSTIEGEQLAIEMLKKSIELDSSYAPAYNQLGLRMQRLAQFGLRDPEETQRAEKFYLKALSLNGELLSALGDLAMLYAETARTEKAVEVTRQMLEINPNNAAAHFSLGYIYRYAGMLDESIQEMEKAVAIDPRNPRFRTLGVTYMNVGEYEKAIDAFDIDKGSAYALGWQGHVLFRQGNQERAVDYFDRVIAMEPEGLWGLVATTFKALIQGNIKEGLHATHKLEQANIADAEGWYYWAGNYGLLGDRAGCIRALQRAVDGGYFNYPFMLTDSFLDPVRNHPEFQRILEMAKAKHEAFENRFFPALNK